MTENNPSPSGEQRLKDHRRRFWRYVTIAFIASLLAGLGFGFVLGAHEDGNLPLWLPVSLGIVVLLALVWFTWDYFRRIDELDLMDNLWAHLIGLYGGLFVFGIWTFGHELKFFQEPTAIGIVLAMISIMFLAYGARKLGLR